MLKSWDFIPNIVRSNRVLSRRMSRSDLWQSTVTWCSENTNQIQKNHAKTDVKELIPYVFLSPMSFTVSGLIHFCNPFWVNFSLLCKVVVQFSQYHLLKKLFFPHCVFLASLLKISKPNIRGFIYGLSVLFYWPICLFWLLFNVWSHFCLTTWNLVTIWSLLGI